MKKYIVAALLSLLVTATALAGLPTSGVETRVASEVTGTDAFLVQTFSVPVPVPPQKVLNKVTWSISARPVGLVTKLCRGDLATNCVLVVDVVGSTNAFSGDTKNTAFFLVYSNGDGTVQNTVGSSTLKLFYN